MNQLGGVGAGGIPGRSYAFAPGADGTHKPFYCGHRFGYHLGNNKHLIYPKKDKERFVTIYDKFDKSSYFIIESLEASQNINNTEIMKVGEKCMVNSSYKFSINKTYKITILNSINGENISENIRIIFFIENQYNNIFYRVKLKYISKNVKYISVKYGNPYINSININYKHGFLDLEYADPKNFTLSVLE